jgi:hypothetical protein
MTKTEIKNAYEGRLKSMEYALFKVSVDIHEVYRLSRLFSDKRIEQAALRIEGECDAIAKLLGEKTFELEEATRGQHRRQRAARLCGE